MKIILFFFTYQISKDKKMMISSASENVGVIGTFIYCE